HFSKPTYCPDRTVYQAQLSWRVSLDAPGGSAKLQMLARPAASSGFFSSSGHRRFRGLVVPWPRPPFCFLLSPLSICPEPGNTETPLASPLPLSISGSAFPWAVNSHFF